MEVQLVKPNKNYKDQKMRNVSVRSDLVYFLNIINKPVQRIRKRNGEMLFSENT